MLPARAVALTLAVLAGRAAGLVHPVRLPNKLISYGPATNGATTPVESCGAQRNGCYHRNNPTMLPRIRTGCVSLQCRTGFGLMSLPRCSYSSCSAVFGGSIAGQWMPVRTKRSGVTTINSATGDGSADGSRRVPPVGGYPPPEHLHGVFAVYKPKGFSSSDVVQKIKNILTKGVREELQVRLALENEATQEEGTAEKKVHVDSAASIAASEAVTADSEVGSRGREGTKVKRGGKGGPRRQKGPKVKVGHGGTLDPMATGVLVIGVGKGCRELSKFLKGSKAYRVEALLGYETNTQDAEGEVTLHGEWGHVTKEAVDEALGQFTGDIMQVPPMFSALHKDGKRLYELARQGITVEREARPVTVYSVRQAYPALELPRLGLEVECGGGFYVRTLVEDLARALETRAHMTALERTKQGPFELEHAFTRDKWEYHQLCEHLQDTQERMSGHNMAEEAASPLPAVEAKTAIALER